MIYESERRGADESQAGELRPLSQAQFLMWLGQQLNFRKEYDWYKLNRQHFTEHHGDALFATYYNGSVMRALKDFRPNGKWDEEKMRAARKE